MTVNQFVIDIEGMSCGSCVAHVRTALAKVPGIQIDSVSVGRAVVTLQGSANDRAIRDAIGDAGYEVRQVRPASAVPEPDEQTSTPRGGGCCGGSTRAAVPAAMHHHR